MSGGSDLVGAPAMPLSRLFPPAQDGILNRGYVGRGALPTIGGE
jgi:hypothetical protein